MLIRLLPDQINPHWDKIKSVILEGSQLNNPASEEEVANVLQAVYTGGMTCWISANNQGLNGIVLTSVMEDEVVKKKSLVIYFAYRFGELEEQDWINAMNTLRRYAKSIQCFRMVAHPYQTEVLKLCERLGGELKNYVVEFGLEDYDGNE